MTFSQYELLGLEFCVKVAKTTGGNMFVYDHLLRRILEEQGRGNNRRSRIPRTISETQEYKNAYYAKNAEKFRENARKIYWANKAKKQQAEETKKPITITESVIKIKKPVIAYKDAYYAKHREEILARKRQKTVEKNKQKKGVK